MQTIKMKNVIIFIVLISVNFIHAQEFDIKWGTPKDIEKNTYLVGTYSFDSIAILERMKLTNTYRKEELHELTINQDPFSTNERTLDYKNSTLYYNNFIIDKGYLFHEEYIDGNTIKYFFEKTNSNHVGTGEIVDLMSFNRKKGLNGGFGVLANPMVIWTEKNVLFWRVNSESKIEVFVFNLINFSLYYSKTVDLPKNVANLRFLDIDFNNSGEILFCFSSTVDQKKITFKNTISTGSFYNGDHAHLIQTLLVKKDTTIYDNITPKGNLNFRNASINNYGQDFYIEFIGENLDNSIGENTLVYTANVNDENGKVMFIDSYEFNKPLGFTVNYKKPFIYNDIKFTAISNNSYITISQVKIDINESTNFDFNPNIHGSTSGFNEGFLVTRHDSNGKITWSTYFKNREHFSNHIGHCAFYGSGDYISFQQNANTFTIITNSGSSNPLEEISDTQKGKVSDYTDKTTVVYKMDLESGEYKKTLMKTLEKDEFILPNHTCYLNMNQFLIYKLNLINNIECFGLLTIE